MNFERRFTNRKSFLLCILRIVIKVFKVTDSLFKDINDHAISTNLARFRAKVPRIFCTTYPTFFAKSA